MSFYFVLPLQIAHMGTPFCKVISIFDVLHT